MHREISEYVYHVALRKASYVELQTILWEGGPSALIIAVRAELKRRRAH